MIFNFYHVLDSSLWYLGISSLLFYVFSIFLIKIFIDFDGLDLEFDTFLIMRSPIGFGVFTVQFSWFLTKSTTSINFPGLEVQNREFSEVCARREAGQFELYAFRKRSSQNQKQSNGWT